MTTTGLISANGLERTSVVANNAMNRERGLAGVNSYARELGVDPLDHLAGRPAAPSWLDLCSGEGRALREAISLRGARGVTLPFRYLGADPDAGPNHTGRPAVASHYAATGG